MPEDTVTCLWSKSHLTVGERCDRAINALCTNKLANKLAYLHIQDVSAATEIRLRDELELFENRPHDWNDYKHPGEIQSDGRYSP